MPFRASYGYCSETTGSPESNLVRWSRAGYEAYASRFRNLSNFFCAARACQFAAGRRAFRVYCQTVFYCADKSQRTQGVSRRASCITPVLWPRVGVRTAEKRPTAFCGTSPGPTRDAEHATETGVPESNVSRLRLAVFQTSARYTSKSAEEHLHLCRLSELPPLPLCTI